MDSQSPSLLDIIGNCEDRVIILGTNPLHPLLEDSSRLFADLLDVNPGLMVHILYESDSENFNQELSADDYSTSSRMSYTLLTVHRRRVAGGSTDSGLLSETRRILKGTDAAKNVEERLVLQQMNLRLPLNIVLADDTLWIVPTLHRMPNISSYRKVDPEDELYKELVDYVEFCIDPARGGVYLSKPGDELIELYDRDGVPRGIFPRSCFYTTRFTRYSVWGFVFNRKGELLLHKRSESTKDNRLLWDKSIGGHVDVGDSSSLLTASRELVEELFLPEAEFTKYTQAELGDIINFGDWLPKKRTERSYLEAFTFLGKQDWIVFRATSSDGDPLTVTRVSKRRIHGADGTVSTRRTVFRSDVYLFIAPRDYLDTPEQMKKLVGLAEETGAASDHRLITVSDLSSWIHKTEAEGIEEKTFTDDLLAINLEYSDLLEGFAEFVRFVARS